MKPLYLPLFMGFILSLVSCGPVLTVSRYGMKARLIDAGTKEPLDRVKTRILIDRQEFNKTSGNDGALAVKPNLDWRFSWLGGPALISRFGADIGLEAEGYLDKSLKWQDHLPSGRSPFTEDRGIVDLGTVELEKR